jgi:hypothetical protein
MTYRNTYSASYLVLLAILLCASFASYMSAIHGMKLKTVFS